jgi:voltage-gated potassium channel
VVVEKNPDLVRVMDEDGVLYVSGDAADESNLLKAGIERAKRLIAALATDTDNVFLVLSARQLAPELDIVARASQQGAKNKLRADGTMLFNPSFEAAFRPDDTVIAVGEEQNLQKLEKILNP